MDSNDFSNLGKQIRDTVQDAMDSMNFSELNQTINRTVEQALDEARMHKERIQRQYEQNRTNRQVNLALAPKVRKGMARIILGTVSACLSWGILIFGLVSIPDMVVKYGQAVAVTALGLLAVPAAVSAGLLVSGIAARKNYRLAKKYTQLIDGRGFCQIKEMAAKTGGEEAQIRKSIKKLIRKGMFREAYMDKQETCLMVDRESYEYYLRAEESRKEREAAEEQRKKEENAMSPEIVEMIRIGEQYIRTIREANDDIPGEVISEKLDRLEIVVRRIFDSVKKHPEQKKEMDKFMDYYMPTTLKLVNTYREFDALEVKGSNVRNAMNEIENTLDTIIKAFEKLLDDLFQDAAFDVETDISVLKTMLAREGYKEKDFK